jgi:rare lipoprotein A
MFDMYGLSAAHKTLPMNTWVRVENLENGRRLNVRINDRGPFVHGRIIDLSYGAARQLAVVGPGTARVRVTALGNRSETAEGEARFTPVDFYSGSFTYQVGAFRVRENALRLKSRLERKYRNAHITLYEGPDGLFYRVRVGRFSRLEDARSQEGMLVADGFRDPFIVAE